MKKKIHPQYHSNAQISCSCGNTIQVGATFEKKSTEICSQCSPLFTGKSRVVQTGQVERFKKKMEKVEQQRQALAKAAQKKQEAKQGKQKEQATSKKDKKQEK
jgi:large subunit ribosomal protein L31